MQLSGVKPIQKIRVHLFLFAVILSLSACEQNFGISVATNPEQLPHVQQGPAPQSSPGPEHSPEPHGSPTPHCSPSSSPSPHPDEHFGNIRNNTLIGGFIHTCSIEKDSRKLYCWGYNGNAQLGDGTQVSKNRPVLIDGGTKYAKVAPGPYHTCGLTVDGIVKCWGANPYGEIDAATASDLKLVPFQVGKDFIDVAAGFDSTCAIKRTGELKCWGYSTSLPINLDDKGQPDLFVAVTMSEFHLCAINRKGKLKCAGNNEYGQLGDGTRVSRRKLVEVNSADTYVDMSLANDHTCAITGKGKLRCFGSNSSGQLGDVSTTDRTSPVDVIGDDTYKSVAAGFDFTCAINLQNRMKCFGRNNTNSFGNGSSGYLVPTEPYPGVVYHEIGAGRSHLCAASPTAGLKCAGYNSHGQVGAGYFSPSADWSFVQF